MAGTTFRDRERLILLTGAAAAAFVALVTVAGIAGISLGSLGGKVASSLVVLYLCARLWGHARTLEERGDGSVLAPVSKTAAACALPVLLVQTWFTNSLSVHASIADPVPHLVVGMWTRVEWTADVLVLGLFLITAMSVWTQGTDGVSALLARIAYAVVGFLTLDLLGCVWGTVRIEPQVRLVAALLVLSFAGTIVVATVRRLERLDEPPTVAPPAAPPAGILPPTLLPPGAGLQ